MKLDLYKMFGVEEGEEFKIGTHENPYRIYNNSLQVFDTDLEEWRNSSIMFNYVISSDIIKLPKKKQFTDDELCILRNINKKYNWISRDKNGDLTLFVEKPTRYDNYWDNNSPCVIEMNITFTHLFNSIKWEDEEPVYIDDYVER